METPFFKALLVVAVALGCGGATACASGAPQAAAPTTTTSAELAGSPAMPASREASSSSASGVQLVCRTKTNSDGTTELYLDWKGKVATGELRQTAPSGMVYSQHVRAERYQGTIIVDEPEPADLATHTALVVQQNGKLHMRVGAPGQAVSPCE